MEVRSEVVTTVQTDSNEVASDRSYRMVLVLVIAVGAILRLWGIRFGLPHTLARPDEEFIVALARDVLRDPNPHFFDWPTFFIYLTATAYAVLFTVERAIVAVTTEASFLTTGGLEPTLHLIARAMSAGAGIMTIYVLYRAASELFSKRMGLVAAVFLAVAFLHVRDSHFGVTDVPATFLAVCAFWAGVRCAIDGVTGSRVAIAGLLCGLAASTKYNTALVLLPVAAAISSGVRSARPRSAMFAIRAIAVLLLCAAFGFLFGTPFALLDRPAFMAAVTGVGRHLSAGHVVMPANGWTYHAAFTLRYGLGLPLLIAAIVGACWLLVWRPWTAVLVLLFPVTYYLVLGAGTTVFVRYMVPVVPFMCLTAAFFVDRVSELINQRFSFARARNISAIGLVAIVGVPTALSSVAFDRLLARTDTRVLGADWIEAHFPSGASMYQTGYSYGHLQPKPADRYAQIGFNEEAGRFEVGGHGAELPDVVVLVESPLFVYSRIPRQLESTLDADYVLAMTFDGTPSARVSKTVYDQEDAFFVPFGGVDNSRRPGPNIRIFERRPFGVRPGPR